MPNAFNRQHRFQLIAGNITYVCKAVAKSKKLNGKKMDVFRADENGNETCRNLYSTFYGYYTVDFDGHENWGKALTGCQGFGMCDIPDEKDMDVIYSKYQDFRYLVKKAGPLDYRKTLKALKIWKNNKEIESLFAMGFRNLALTQPIYNIKDKRKVIAWLNKHRDETAITLPELQVRIKYELDAKKYRDYMDFCAEYGKVAYNEYLYLLPLTSKKNPGYKDRYMTISMYSHYKHMAKELKHDFTEKYWYAPKNLFQAHNKILEEHKNYESFKRERDLEKKMAAYIKKESRIIGKKLAVGILEVFVPETAKQVMLQAEALHQCIVSMDYIGKVIRGDCRLVFIYKNGKPYATAEIRKGGVIGQFNGNQQNHKNYTARKDAKDALAAWGKKYHVTIKEAA